MEFLGGRDKDRFGGGLWRMEMEQCRVAETGGYNGVFESVVLFASLKRCAIELLDSFGRVSCVYEISWKPVAKCAGPFREISLYIPQRIYDFHNALDLGSLFNPYMLNIHIPISRNRSRYLITCSCTTSPI